MALTKVRGSGIDADGQEIILDADTDTTITADTDDQVDIKTGGTDRAVFLANNMHLIGGTVARVQLSSSGSGTTPNTGNNNVHIEGNDDTLVLNSAGNGNTIFQENGTERMRINTDGHLLIGTTTANLSNTNSDEHIILEQDGEFKMQGAAKILMTLNRNQTAGEIISIKQENTAVGGIDANSSSVDFNTSSDYRLKENVTTSWDATTRLKQLKPIRFSWKKEGKSEADTDGFLAHEVSSVVPQATKGTKDEVVTQKGIDDGVYPKDAKIGDAYMQSIDHSKLVPLLVKTIQELEARLTALESK